MTLLWPPPSATFSEVAAFVAASAPKPEPAPVAIFPAVPLTGPDGAVYSYACGRCHHAEAGPDYVVRRDRLSVDDLASLRRSAEQHCVCRCGAPIATSGIGYQCAACEAADRARIAESQAKDDALVASCSSEEVAAMWSGLSADHDPWPVAIFTGRDGFAWIALPCEVSDVPSDLTERLECHEWIEAHADAPIGFGKSPGEAWDALRARIKKGPVVL